MSGQMQEILVVSNPGDREEIGQVLASAGYPEPRWGDGGDETYGLYEAHAPVVAIVCANLEAGDARSLAAAMRAGPHGHLHIILVGEVDGPIRNALDAADFSVDRFVSRPLAPKALLYCVRAGLEGRPLTDPGLPTTPQRAALVPGGKAALSQAIDLAIDDFVAEAIGSIGHLVAMAAPMGELTVPSIGDDDDEAERRFEVLSEEPAAGDGWQTEAPPPREPTLIISDSVASGAVPQAAVAELTERQHETPWTAASVDDVGELDDEPPVDVELADLDDELSDLQDDIDDGTSPRVTPVPSGGAFARQLREKMSIMAERLFPGRTGDVGKPLVDVGVAHGHQTEIDLATMEIDSHVSSLEPEPAPYADLASAETFADAEFSSTTAEPGGSDAGDTTTRASSGTETSERGELDAMQVDVASILARMFTTAFTGRVTFRAAPAEKVVYFDHGRPVFASSNLPHDRMGDLLYREGKITRAHYDRSRELLVESGRRMGEILVEMGYLKRRELLPAVRRHIEDIVYSLFGWRSGEYVVKPGEFASEERIRLSKHPAALILEGVRRKYDLAQLETRMGSAGAIVAVAEASKLKPVLTVADLSRAERAAIAAMDGEKTLEEVASLIGVSLQQTYQLAYGLVVLDVAEVLRRGDDGEGAIDAVRPPTLVGETDLAIDRQRVMAKYSLVSEADYFALLGVRRDASGFEIKRAYESARRDYAEESFPGEVRDELGDQIGEINELLDEAYRVLCDDALRGSYLAHLRD